MIANVATLGVYGTIQNVTTNILDYSEGRISEDEYNEKMGEMVGEQVFDLVTMGGGKGSGAMRAAEEGVGTLKTSFRTATKTGEALSKVKQSIRELTKDFVENLGSNKLSKISEKFSESIGNRLGKSSFDFIEKGKRFLGGKRASAIDIQAIIDEVSPKGIQVIKKADAIIKKANPDGLAAFDFRNKRILLPDGVTKYALQHELEHARHFIEVGEDAYKAAGKFAREERVFNKIMENKHMFNEMEIKHANRYIDDLKIRKSYGVID